MVNLTVIRWVCVWVTAGLGWVVSIGYRLIVIGYSYKKVEWIRISEVTGLEGSD